MILKELSKLYEASQQRYGLILVNGGDDVDFDMFEETEVFLNKKDFENRIKELFAKHIDDLSFEDKSIEEIEDHEEWSNFCDSVWMINKF